MQTLLFFSPARMKALPKPPSGFCLHLAAFKKYVDKFKLSLSLKNHFLELTRLPPILVMLCFALWFSLWATLSLSESLFASRFNPIHISKHHSTWVPWQSTLYFSTRQGEESR